MKFDKNIGIITLMAEVYEKDIDLDKVENFLGVKIDREDFIIYREIIERVLIETNIDINGDVFSGAYIVDVISDTNNTLKLVYLPPFPWDKHEWNKSLFKVSEKDVKDLMAKVLEEVTSLNEKEISEAITYSNL